jgi:acyl-homoserine-lactone acylase
MAPVSVAAASGTHADDGPYSAQIRRTEHGIPHILANDFGSLGYGYGYAFAQDNLCELAQRMVTLHGQRSQYFGATASAGDTLAGDTTNLISDEYYQGINQSGVVAKLLAEPAPQGPTGQVTQLVAGYVAGYNRYLSDTGAANLPDPTCRGAAWVAPITANDIWTEMYDVDQLGGIEDAKQQIATAAPPGSMSPASTRKTPPSIPDDFADRIGSNGWAIGSGATQDGDGMLLANPHYPWLGDGRFYQVQLTIPGTLNVTGASLYGTPVVEIGHTQSLAWTHTVSTASRFTLYQLSLVPGQPTSYLIDGKAVAMTTVPVSVRVRNTDGSMSTVNSTLYMSRYGPVAAEGWTSSTAYALDGASMDNIRSINEWLAMDESESLAQLHTAQNTYQGIPFINTIATDTSGTAFYGDMSVVPNVTDAEEARCSVPAGAGILDGSTSSCAWGTDQDAIEPGIFGPSHDPQLTRTDYVANSNNTAWLANPAAPLTGYPAIYGASGSELAPRPRLSLTMLSQRIAGTDGLGSGKFTLSTLQQTALGDRDYTAELDRDAVVSMCQANPVLTGTDGDQITVSPACPVLANWDLRTDTGDRGAVLWRQFWQDLTSTAASDSWWKVPFDPNHPTTTPNTLNTGDVQVQRALANAVEFFQRNSIPLDTSVGSAQRYQSIGIPGCPSFEGCFSAIGTPSSAIGYNGTYGDVVDGSSFIMAVDLTPNGPNASTILTYSESSNPDSLYYTDQTKLFSQKQWVTDRFSESQIAADPDLQTVTIQS